jgi:ferredoxin-fold anticodon binding domain-containing protein
MNKEEMIFKMMEMLLNVDSKENTVTKEKHPMIGKYVIIRTYSAGVHIGFLKSVDGAEVIIEKARQIYYWKGAFTLRELSLNGVSEGSKITAEIPMNSLTKIEIIPVSDDCAKKLQEYPSYVV